MTKGASSSASKPSKPSKGEGRRGGFEAFQLKSLRPPSAREGEGGFEAFEAFEGSTKPLQPQSRRLRSLPLLRSLRSPLRSPSHSLRRLRREAFEGGLRNICLVSFSYLFFFVLDPQKRSRVAFSFFRLERTLAFSEGGLFGFIFFLSLFLRF